MPRKREATTAERLAANVRERRTDAGLTQLELALEMGVNPSLVYWMERSGRYSPASIEAAAKALGCTVSELTA